MSKTSHIHFTGDIRVQNMQRQSGIFIGERNIAIGWSAHSKENRVIGNIGGQQNLLFYNISILQDPDIIDTPIDDRDINLSFDQPGNENTTNLTMDNFNVNAMSHTNSIFLGKGHVTGMDTHDKVNYTQGNVFGNKNHLIHNANINHDEDLIDGVINDQDIKMAFIERE